MGRPVVNLLGERFGMLTPIRFAYVRNGHAYWKCKCKCGEMVTIRSDAIRTQDTCGIDRNHISDRSERFWSHVEKKGRNDCWEWTAMFHRQGYGMVRDVYGVDGRQKMRYAHIVAYELEVGLVPEGLELRHVCDNQSCCNPRHLIPGTHEDNMRDRKRGVRVRHVEQARVLLARGIPRTELVEDLGLSVVKQAEAV